MKSGAVNLTKFASSVDRLKGKLNMVDFIKYISESSLKSVNVFFSALGTYLLVRIQSLSDKITESFRSKFTANL